ADTVHYGKAFYDFFRVHELRPLSEPEACDVLKELARVRNAPGVARLVDEDPARIRTTLALSWGNPRTIAQLYRVLARSTEGDARSDLEMLLDEHTPIYKARLEALSMQAQRIAGAVALHWHPVSTAEIAEKAGLDANIVSSQ